MEETKGVESNDAIVDTNSTSNEEAVKIDNGKYISKHLTFRRLL